VIGQQGGGLSFYVLLTAQHSWRCTAGKGYWTEKYSR